MMTRLINSIVLASLLWILGGAGCGGDTKVQETPDTGVQEADASGELVVPATYTFASRFAPAESSVSYSGQVLRQVLIAELTGYVGRLTTEIDSGAFAPEAGQVEAALQFYYGFDSSTSGQVELTLTTADGDPPILQGVYDAIATGKDLKGKFAGNDPVGQHQDWSTDFVGWAGAETPEALLLSWFAELDARALAHAQGNFPTDPDGTVIASVQLTADGRDLQQLMQKFLLVAVTLSQGMDDYLDDATAEKGLNALNERDGEAPYTLLEHTWDEGFGYFGAAQDYNDYTDEEVAAKGGRDGWSAAYHDTSGDGMIDLLAEYNFGAATNAAKRDLGSSAQAPTDFSKAIFDAFLTGRAIISAADVELTGEEKTALLAQRDIVVENWEKAIAATIIHYINEVVRDMDAFGGDTYVFADHAKHWSEMKGFALGLQFSPFSPVSAAQFAELHERMGDAPVLAGADPTAIDAYRTGLLAARDILAQAYQFTPANTGDENGENGW